MKPIPLEVTMMKIIGELKAENAQLKAEVERLKNNVAYLDKKLDEELDGPKA
jgi:cell division protein FtsB